MYRQLFFYLFLSCGYNGASFYKLTKSNENRISFKFELVWEKSYICTVNLRTPSLIGWSNWERHAIADIGSSPIPFIHTTKEKAVFIIKQISKEEMTKLLKHNYVKNTKYGIVNNNGSSVGYYRTRHRRYIEDKYADLAKTL